MSGTQSTELPMLDQVRKTLAFLREKQVFHKLGVLAEPDHHRYRLLRALSHAARARFRRARRRAEGEAVAVDHARHAVRRGRLLHADILRPVRAAHDRPLRRALPDRGACRLHQLFDRPQRRRQRAHRRRGALPRVLGVGPERGRRREGLLRRRTHLLARQRRGARPRHQLPSGGRRARSIACRSGSTRSLPASSSPALPATLPGSGCGRASSAAASGP